MKLHELSPAEGSKKAVKRIGRGVASGQGKTAGKGHKGAKARSGYSRRPGFEGGQMPLQRRVPKRGFNNIFREEYAIVNVDALNERFEANSIVDAESLKACGLVKKELAGIKVLGNGDITKALTVKVNAVSESAKSKIEAAGGTVEVL
ncbi:MAG: 50S ribosomal protein L15 [Clostridiales bacterium]|nr:50S ribosomal protein L15 [Clostridiales bacterium]